MYHDEDIETDIKQQGSETTKGRLFEETLLKNNLSLLRACPNILQLNTGLLCNQICKHCHLSAGPGHTDKLMSKDTMTAALKLAERYPISVIDITGGAPEMHPDIDWLIEASAGLVDTVILRSNLSALSEYKDTSFLELLKKHRVTIVASLPSINAAQADTQRGDGIFDTSIQMLKKLCDMGYGKPDKGLELNLVSNPVGAFLPAPQAETQRRFKRILKNKWDIEFNSLFTFANMPLGRFKTWLLKTGNYNGYLKKLSNVFNPCTLEGLMCKTIISVSWDGYLFDCDFNQAAGLPMGGCDNAKKVHVSEPDALSIEGQKVTIGDHCFACTAGKGFT